MFIKKKKYKYDLFYKNLKHYTDMKRHLNLLIFLFYRNMLVLRPIEKLYYLVLEIMTDSYTSTM